MDPTAALSAVASRIPLIKQYVDAELNNDQFLRQYVDHLVSIKAVLEQLHVPNDDEQLVSAAQQLQRTVDAVEEIIRRQSRDRINIALHEHSELETHMKTIDRDIALLTLQRSGVRQHQTTFSSTSVRDSTIYSLTTDSEYAREQPHHVQQALNLTEAGIRHITTRDNVHVQSGGSLALGAFDLRSVPHPPSTDTQTPRR